MSLETVAEWILDANTCFLVGAGCSKCAGKPLISELTDAVKTKLSDRGRSALNILKGSYGRAATIEDLINYLNRTQSLRALEKNPDEADWTSKAIEEELVVIKKSIIDTIGIAWTTSATHEKFLRRLMQQTARPVCDIFSLNYDTILEATLENLKFPYTDGFTGSETAHFAQQLFDDKTVGQRFRIYKLHGSINWVRDHDETVRRRPLQSIGDHPRAVIFPAEQKYVQTQYGVYEILLGKFRERLRQRRPNNKLVVLGYSFCEDHINLAIEDSIRAEGSNLTVYALIGPEANTANQEKRLREIAERCRNRFNAIIGATAFIGDGLETEDWKQIKNLNLWKFEVLVSRLTGGGA
jgi:hypothetical protein